MSLLKGIAGLLGGLVVFLLGAVMWYSSMGTALGGLFFTIAILGLALIVVAPAWYWGGNRVWAWLQTGGKPDADADADTDWKERGQ